MKWMDGMPLEDVTEGELVVPSKLAKFLWTDAKEIAGRLDSMRVS
jgi:hypothetical protein